MPSPQPKGAKFAEGRVGEILRYGLVGLANTGLGLTVILAVKFLLHAPPILANACGYGVGIVASFLLNRGFVFRSQAKVGAAGLRYGLSVAFAYGINLFVLILAEKGLPQTPLFQACDQLFAMGAYTISLYLLSRSFFFKGVT